MSTTLTEADAPPLRTRVPAANQDWKATVFRELGWASKSIDQAALRQEMQGLCRVVDETTLRAGIGPNCADAIVAEKLKPGDDFKAFTAALSYFEKAPGERRAQLAEGLQKAAHGYLAHYAGHRPRQQNQPETLRKKAICEAALLELDRLALSADLKRMPDPPWDDQTQQRAATLKATLDFETLPPGERRMQTLGGKHAYPAFWVNKDEGAGQQQTFIFKPVPAHSAGDDTGWRETASEAAVGRLGDMLRGMTGLDFAVPETHLVALGPERFPDDLADAKIAKPVQGGKIAGSLQQFSKSEGELMNQTADGRRAISVAAIEKICVLDMLSLNADRHAGNLLIGTKQGAPCLVPIDHGLAFETSTITLANKLGDLTAAVLTLPNATEPFTKEMRAAVTKIDPDVMAAGLRLERGSIEAAFPAAKGAITDAAIEMSRRSAMFLKLAMKHPVPMSPAATQIALGQNADALFNTRCDDATFTRMALTIIDHAAITQDELTDYLSLSAADNANITGAMQELGFSYGRGDMNRKWLLSNPGDALALLRTATPLPRPAALTVEWDADYDDDLRSLGIIFPDSGAKNLPPEQQQETVALWREFQSLGGLQALDDSCETLQVEPSVAAANRKLIGRAIDCMRIAAAIKTARATAAGKDKDELAIRYALRGARMLAALLEPSHRLRAELTTFEHALPHGGGFADKRADLSDLVEEMEAEITTDLRQRLDSLAIRLKRGLQEATDIDHKTLERHQHDVDHAIVELKLGGSAIQLQPDVVRLEANMPPGY